MVGLPGDEVVYLDKKLVVNGEPAPLTRPPRKAVEAAKGYKHNWQILRIEKLGGKKHAIVLNPNISSEVQPVAGMSQLTAAATAAGAWSAGFPKASTS